MNKMTTASIDTCGVTPRCPGCYLEYIKDSPDSIIKESKTLEEIIIEELKAMHTEAKENPNSDFVFNSNISSPKDVNTWITIISNNVFFMHEIIWTKNIQIRLIGPVALLNNQKLIHSATVVEITLCTTLNVFLNIPKREQFTNLDILMKDKYEIELSMNSTLVNHKKLKDVICQLSPKSILLNYIHTNPDLKKNEVFMAFNGIESYAPDCEIIYSPCVLNAFDMSEKPCEKYEIKDMIIMKNKEIKSKHGCPFPVKTCEMK